MNAVWLIVFSVSVIAFQIPGVMLKKILQAFYQNKRNLTIDIQDRSNLEDIKLLKEEIKMEDNTIFDRFSDFSVHLELHLFQLLPKIPRPISSMKNLIKLYSSLSSVLQVVVRKKNAWSAKQRTKLQQWRTSCQETKTTMECKYNVLNCCTMNFTCPRIIVFILGS